MISAIKEIIKKMNLYIIFQAIWLFEFYVLAAFAGTSLFEKICKNKVQIPDIITEYGKLFLDFMKNYNSYVGMCGIILLTIGISGTFFKEIPFLGRYKLIQSYCDFGLYASGWCLIIFFTYKLYKLLDIFFLPAPFLLWLLFLLLKKVKLFLEEHGITFES